MQKVKTCQDAVVAAQARGLAHLQVPGVDGNHRDEASYHAVPWDLAAILATKWSLQLPSRTNGLTKSQERKTWFTYHDLAHLKWPALG